MSKIEREREKQCQECQYYNTCLVKWGKACKYQLGRKIPRFYHGYWVYYTRWDGSIGRRPRGRDVLFG